jgi:hypothetical protein
MNRSVLFPGAVPMVYDGQLLTEHYFLWPPEGALMELDVGAGALSAGDYQVALVWEYRTNTGDRMQSPPSLARTSGGDTEIAAANNDAIAIEVPPLTLTQKCDATDWSTEKRRGVVLKVYRTIANGDVFYLDADEDATPVNEPYLSGFAGSAVLTATTATADATIEVNETLYTTGGELEHYPFPALDFVATHDNRWFGIPSEDPYALVFSSQQILGEVPWHHPSLGLRLDEDGPNVALAALDDKLVVFKRHSIWVVIGQGPDATGGNATYVAQRVSSDQGCAEKRSVVVNSDGVYFQSNAGIHLLTRGLQLQLVSGPVDRQFDQTLVITSAAALPDRQEIYWNTHRVVEAGDGPEETNPTLVYNWQNRQWAIDHVSNGDGGDALFASGVYHRVAYGGTYYATRGAALVYSHEGYADGDDWIPLKVTTAWIKLAGIQGYQRVRWLGVMGELPRPHDENAHNWTVRVAYDYEVDEDAYDPTPDWAQEQSYTAAQIAAWTMTSHSARLHLEQQKCQSIIVRVEDSLPDAGTVAEGARLVSLALDVGLKKQMHPAPQLNMQRT